MTFTLQIKPTDKSVNEIKIIRIFANIFFIIRGRYISLRVKQKLCLPNSAEQSPKTAVKDGRERGVSRRGGLRVVVSVNKHWSALRARVGQPSVDRPAVVDQRCAFWDTGGKCGGRIPKTFDQADIKMGSW